jgi:Kef-type K+ transport system membrane component KefB
MHHLDVPQTLGTLAVMLAAAKLLGVAAQRIGQPAVLGELVAGVLLGGSVLGLADPTSDTLYLFAEIGVVILLLEIGLETDLGKLLRVGGESSLVAAVGVALPFLLGYGVCLALGQGSLVAITAGAALTATSVGITARVLSDLHRLQEPESQIILGAAVIDDVIGLVILAVVAGLTEGKAPTVLGVAEITAVAVGFLAATLLVGWLVVPPLARWIDRFALPGAPTLLAILLAFGLAWLASVAGSAVILGAFATGLLLRRTPQARQIERGVAPLGHFFVPLFFVAVGAAVDVHSLNPFNPANHSTLAIGGLLIVAAVVGKFAAGYAPFWFSGNKKVIGVGMIPRGEVGLIFAQMGLAAGVFSAGLFSAVTLMVMVTTFIAPPLLRLLFPPSRSARVSDPAGG